MVMNVGCVGEASSLNYNYAHEAAPVKASYLQGKIRIYINNNAIHVI